MTTGRERETLFDDPSASSGVEEPAQELPRRGRRPRATSGVDPGGEDWTSMVLLTRSLRRRLGQLTDELRWVQIRQEQVEATFRRLQERVGRSQEFVQAVQQVVNELQVPGPAGEPQVRVKAEVLAAMVVGQFVRWMATPEEEAVVATPRRRRRRPGEEEPPRAKLTDWQECT